MTAIQQTTHGTPEVQSVPADSENVLLHKDQVEQLAHDLVNALTVLKGISQSIVRKIGLGLTLEQERLESDMRAVSHAVTRAVDEIDQFLESARSSRPSAALVFVPLNFAEVVEEAVADARQVTTTHTFVVATGNQAFVGPGERGLLLHAFDNILRNAIKYSPTGGTITVTLAADDQGAAPSVVITVHDEGIGIPAASLPHVFDRFFRAENVASIPGTGLGLAGTRQVVEAHRGAVGVESVEGQGCTFTVRLPLAAAA